MPTPATETSQALIPLTQLFAPLAILLTFSFFIERMLEALGWLMDKLEISRKLLVWKAPVALEEKLELGEKAARESELLAAPKDREILNKYEEIPFHPKVRDKKPPSLLSIQEVTPPDSLKVRKEFWCHLFGVLIGVAGCFYWKISFLRLINATELVQPAPRFWEYILLGIIIGSGSKPIHFLMNFLLTRKIVLAKEMTEPDAEIQPQAVLAFSSVGASAVAAHSPKMDELIGFHYDGGDRPARLECSHLRPKQPDLILYHHTTMHSNASFADLVEVFDQRGWLTGYHCVVFYDGSIRALCRWDRIGNHAIGYNQRSLGLAFQGCFESDPRVPCSNIQGNKGLLEPTLPQLEAGARIVALWCALYGISLDFTAAIRPHGSVADKACPGSRFPTTRFQTKISEYYTNWQADAVFAAALKSFKEQPMIMA